ncbi:MAG: hypothetical protein Q8941_21815 [Bacteroidota bacterium]|nr:hypothetical protein [Bacteroidota bacterium]
MSIYKQNESFYNQPIRLTEEQKKDPIQVIDDFFDAFELASSREQIADWLQCALASDNVQFAEPLQRDRIILFAEKIEELMEAALIINSRKKRK